MAIPLVAVFLVLNAVIVVVAVVRIVARPGHRVGLDGRVDRDRWRARRRAAHRRAGVPAAGAGAVRFRDRGQHDAPGRGRRPDKQARLAARIRNTRRLLTTAALIMSVYLISTTFVTTALIPAEEFQPGGAANGRALAFLAHDLPGRGVRHRLRRQQRAHPLVRRRLGDGRADQHRAALPAVVRDGAGVGAGGAPGGDRLHRGQRRHHHRLPGRRQRPGRGVRHRHPGDDGLRRGGGDDLRGPPAPARPPRSASRC